MEILVLFILASAAVALFSVRAGHDSRPGPYSPEEQYSDLGLRWGFW